MKYLPIVLAATLTGCSTIADTILPDISMDYPAVCTDEYHVSEVQAPLIDQTPESQYIAEPCVIIPEFDTTLYGRKK